MRANIGAAGLVALACVLMVDETAAQVAGGDTGREFKELSRRAEAVQDTHPAEAASWYRKALAIRPDWADGWLTLVGLEWLKPGVNTFGSAQDNRIQLHAGAPAHIGLLTLAQHEDGAPQSIGVYDQKENTPRCEQTAALALLKNLPALDGKTVTADALHCQKPVASTIVAKGGEYLLQIKGNQPGLLKQAQAFDAIEGPLF